VDIVLLAVAQAIIVAVFAWLNHRHPDDPYEWRD